MRTAIVHEEVWISLIAVVSIFIHFAQGQTCTPIDQCSCKFPNGTLITLWGIDRRHNIASSVPGTYYLYRPCTGLIVPNTDCNGVVGCQVGTKQSVIAFKPKYADVSLDETSKSYRFIYTGGIAEQLHIKYKLLVLLKCDLKTDASFSEMLGCSVGVCVVELTSKCACPGACSIPKPSPGQNNRTLSAGSVLCIILLVLVVVYVFAGVAINKYALHKEGSDVIPQKAFWSDIPSLVKDGCIFTYEITFKRKKGDYEQI